MMVKHQVTDKNSLASKDLEDVQSKKKRNRWIQLEKGKGEKEDSSQKQNTDQVKQIRSSSLRARTLELAYGCETTHFLTFQTLSVFWQKMESVQFKCLKKWSFFNPMIVQVCE